MWNIYDIVLADAVNKSCLLIVGNQLTFWHCNVLGGKNLYVLSNDKLYSGEAYYNINTQKISHWKTSDIMTDYTKKIIATTDKSLETIEHEKYPNGNSKGIRVDRKVYNLPMQFINEYIKEYNLVCVRQLNLDKVSVELDDDNNIKVDNDNNISVRPCLRFWTLDEVTQLCNAAFFHKDLNRGLPYDYSDTGFIRWVNENI